MKLFNTWVVFSSHHKKRLNLVLNTGIDVVFKIEGSKRFVYESILYPVVVVCRKKFTYFCPRLSLGFLENETKVGVHNISRWSHAKYFAGFYVLVLSHLRVRKSYFQIKSILCSKILQCINFCNVLEMDFLLCLCLRKL